MFFIVIMVRWLQESPTFRFCSTWKRNFTLPTWSWHSKPSGRRPCWSNGPMTLAKRGTSTVTLPTTARNPFPACRWACPNGSPKSCASKNTPSNPRQRTARFVAKTITQSHNYASMSSSIQCTAQPWLFCACNPVKLSHYTIWSDGFFFLTAKFVQKTKINE